MSGSQVSSCDSGTTQCKVLYIFKLLRRAYEFRCTFIEYLLSLTAGLAEASIPKPFSRHLRRLLFVSTLTNVLGQEVTEEFSLNRNIFVVSKKQDSSLFALY